MSPELRWLFHRAKPLLHLHALSLLCIAGSSVLTLIDPLIMKWLVDVVLPKRDGIRLLIGTSGFAAVYLGRLALMYCGSIFSFIAVQKMMFRVRLRLIRAIHRRSSRYQEDMPIGELQYRIEQDVSRVGDLGGDMLPTTTRMVLVAVMVSTTMCILNLHLTLVVLPLLPVFYILQRKRRVQLVHAADRSQGQAGTMSAILQEHLSGIVQLQLLNRHGAHAQKYAQASAQGAQYQIQQRLAEIHFSAAYLLIVALGSTAVLGYGGHEVIRGSMSIGGLVAFYSYVARLFEPLGIAIDLQSKVQRVAASVRRIIEIENPKIDHTAAQGRRLERDLSPSLEFRSVSFRHRRDRVALQTVDLRVDFGEKIALVGPSGCGKSTIAYLAAGLYDPDAGSILLDGQDIRLVQRRNLRSIVSLVPQDPILFNATLRENVLYGDPHATDRDLELVLSWAQLEGVVSALPRGLDEPLGPMGRRLSGGEKKRVALARAMLRRPKVMILDEVTSELDGPTAMRLLRALDDFQDGNTIILISHEAKTISWADRILVLSRGRIIDQGSHPDLIRRCHLYRELHHGRSDTVIFEEIHNSAEAGNTLSESN